MSNDQRTLRIRFEDLELSEAGSKAEILRQDLLAASEDVTVSIEKDDPSTMDFGATLVLVLGTPAVLAVAKGMADYLRRERGKITIATEEGIVIASGISGADAARIAEALSSKT